MMRPGDGCALAVVRRMRGGTCRERARARDVLATVDIAVAIVAPQGLGTGRVAVEMLRGNVGHLITIADRPTRRLTESRRSRSTWSCPNPSAEQDLISRV